MASVRIATLSVILSVAMASCASGPPVQPTPTPSPSPTYSDLGHQYAEWLEANDRAEIVCSWWDRDVDTALALAQQSGWDRYATSEAVVILCD